MPPRIVVFGATGYTGRLTAERLVAAGRAPGARGSLRRAAGGARRARSAGSTSRVADVDRPDTVTALLEPGDVLLSTVGPFLRWGEPALRAAIAAGGDLRRLDRRAAVHPARVRRVRRRARAAPARPCCTAMGYDFVPGCARRRARARGRRARPRCASTSATTRSAAGRRRSAAARALAGGIALEPRVRLPRRPRADGPLGRARARLRRPRPPAAGDLGRRRRALHAPARLPAPARGQRLPRLVRAACRAPIQLSSRASAALTRDPRHAARAGGRRRRSSPASAGAGPAPGTTPGHRVVRRRRRLRRRRRAARRGRAWPAPTPTTSPRASSRGPRAAPRARASHATGAAGPLEAFGLDALQAGCAEAGLERVGAVEPSGAA